MNTLAVPTIASHKRPPSTISNVLRIGSKELRDAMAARWFVMYTIAFAALGLGVASVSSIAGGLAGFGRTSAGLVNLVLLVVPLMSLTAGAGAIASDRERGMLLYVLAQPMTRLELLIGKYVGLAGAILSSLSLGLGISSLALAWKGQSGDPLQMVRLAGLAYALALTMLSVGFLVSVMARRTSVAIGAAVFLWLIFAFVSDLGLMAGVVALRLPIERLFALAMCNPLQVFKMWALYSSEASLDVLGPAGLYATEELGDKLHLLFAASLALWWAVPLVLAGVIFQRRAIS